MSWLSAGGRPSSSTISSTSQSSPTTGLAACAQRTARAPSVRSCRASPTRWLLLIVIGGLLDFEAGLRRTSRGWLGGGKALDLGPCDDEGVVGLTLLRPLLALADEVETVGKVPCDFGI